jgi:hypothetical protein
MRYVYHRREIWGVQRNKIRAETRAEIRAPHQIFSEDSLRRFSFSSTEYQAHCIAMLV